MLMYWLSDLLDYWRAHMKTSGEWNKLEFRSDIYIMWLRIFDFINLIESKLDIRVKKFDVALRPKVGGVSIKKLEVGWSSLGQ